MNKLVEFLESKPTRLRIIAGVGVVVVWIVFSLLLLVMWSMDSDLNDGGILNLYNAISATFASILGLHMVTKPKG